MRKILGLISLAGLFLLILEGASSYVLYRHFSSTHRAYYPTGSATISLMKYVAAKRPGRRDEIDLSVDHGPLFHADPKLGYAMFPGNYQITEKRGGQSHRFSLTIDTEGRRITSFHPSGAPKRMFIAGDSAMFGWGLSDEQTIPWLLQTRFPAYNVINLSLTSYSTIHAILQIGSMDPAVTADDIVVLTYHPITNDFNVASTEMLGFLTGGFERKLGDSSLAKSMLIPFGSVVRNELKISAYRVECAENDSSGGECSRDRVSAAEAMQVTARAFDAILASHPAHYVVAFLSGSDADPVIAHLKSKGVTIADLRTAPSDPDANDEVSIDEHAGPFWHYMACERLAGTLRRSLLAD